MSKISLQDLKERQKWTLDQKIYHAAEVMDTFIQRMGSVDKVYIALSGGKDSTVLMHLAMKLYPGIKGVFVCTGMENPDIMKFIAAKIKEGWDIDVVRPKMRPREVWAKYGFPMVSKQVAQAIHDVQYNPNSATAQYRLSPDNFRPIAMRWRYLINEPYMVSDRCCHKLKKEPMARYMKETGRHGILGLLAEESDFRTHEYVKNGGCNVFGKVPTSRPLSIWTDKDIWEYADRYGVRFAEIYYKGVDRTGCMGCAMGVYNKDDNRLEILYRFFPKCYEMVMNYTNNGVTYREALRKLLAVCYKHLPDEQPGAWNVNTSNNTINNNNNTNTLKTEE